MRTLAILLAALFLAAPLHAVAKKAAGGGKAKTEGKAKAAGPKDPFQSWMEADDLVKQSKAPDAVLELRNAVGVINKLADDAQVTGPGGARWPKPEALYHYLMRAGEVATLSDYRDSVPFYELAVKYAPDKELKKDARLKLKAAQDNVAAGVKAAPNFMGDDYGEIHEAALANQKKPAKDEDNASGSSKKDVPAANSWENQIKADPRE